MKFSSAVVVVCFLCVCPRALEADDLLEDVFRVLEKELDFFAEDYSSINVDGVFGLRLGQGQIKAAIRECKRKSCDDEILARLERFEKKLEKTCDSALPYVKAKDEDYFNRFAETITKPYDLSYIPTLFDEDALVQTGTNSDYDEEAGDACFGRILGTFIENNKKIPRCNVTHQCWDFMTRDDTSAYVITHQLLYFTLIEHTGCTESVETYMKNKNVFEVQKGLCRKIYEEAKDLERDGKVSYHRKDLFLEQTLVCGSLGFENFMRPDWIRMVIGWPDKRLGCFRSMFIQSLMEDTSLLDNSSKDIENRANGNTMRKLLRESTMKDGCLAHTSGLGFGAFSTYLRFLLRHS